MTDTHILVIEDDPSLGEWICDALNEHGYQVSLANRGDTGLELIEQDSPDLVLLDNLLPGLKGFDVCQRARQFYSGPILMLTACSEEVDEILGLELGADDYLTKPIRPRVLLARIQALLRRPTGQASTQTLSFGQLVIDGQSRSVTLSGQPITLTASEFQLLEYLAQSAGQIVDRNRLSQVLRGIDYDGFDRAVDVCISRLRKKLNDTQVPAQRIKTLRGQGYLFALDAWV